MPTIIPLSPHELRQRVAGYALGCADRMEDAYRKGCAAEGDSLVRVTALFWRLGSLTLVAPDTRTTEILTEMLRGLEACLRHEIDRRDLEAKRLEGALGMIEARIGLSIVGRRSAAPVS